MKYLAFVTIICVVTLGSAAVLSKLDYAKVPSLFFVIPAVTAGACLMAIIVAAFARKIKNRGEGPTVIKLG